MHNMVNALYNVQKDLKEVMEEIDDSELKQEGQELLEKMTAWDEDMIQRKSEAYDDVENFPNKFTAEYLFLINQTNSSIPRVNKSNLERKKELDQQWTSLKSRADDLMKNEIPSFNTKLWNAGIGALRL